MRFALPCALALIAPAPALAEITYGLGEVATVNYGTPGENFTELRGRLEYRLGDAVFSVFGEQYLDDTRPENFERVEIGAGYLFGDFGVKVGVEYVDTAFNVQDTSYTLALQYDSDRLDAFAIAGTRTTDEFSLERVYVDYTVNDVLTLGATSDLSQSFEVSRIFADYDAGRWQAQLNYIFYTGSVDRQDVFITADYQITDDLSAFGAAQLPNLRTGSADPRYDLGASYAVGDDFLIEGRVGWTAGATDSTSWSLALVYEFGEPAFLSDAYEYDIRRSFVRYGVGY